ncbi:MAG TPA: hypothetical protein VHG32_26135 [Thermoanaerobaculia bacterium]|nr:hypothetical protein [Thermoanaerobaculia bacterium]
MDKSSGNVVEFPGESSRDVLTEVLRRGAQEMLKAAVEAEIAAYVGSREHLLGEAGHRVP